MSFFGFKSSREVEEEKRRAVAQATAQTEARTKAEIAKNLATGLNNLGKGSQCKFAIPYFDVYDPRFSDFGCPVAVHGAIVYAIEDMNRFSQINKTQQYSDSAFMDKLRGQVVKYIKSVVSNAPAEHQIPVVQLERKILEISQLVQQYVTPQIETLFAIKVRSLDITNIVIDKDSRGYRELKAVSTDLERDRLAAQNRISISGWQQQQEMDMEMKRLQTVESMRMQMENQREMMRIQREGLEAGQQAMINEAQENGRVSKLFQGSSMFGSAQMMGSQSMFGGLGQATPPAMGGMAPPPMPQATPFFVFLNGQQAGPFDMNQLAQLVQQGQLTPQTQVWTQGMPQWAPASSVPALAPLFAPPAMGGNTPPPMGGGMTPPPMGGNGPLPTPTL